jgi:cbb3-type cytochrome oxidase cytochrome c subunit
MKMTPAVIVVGGLAMVLGVISFVVFLPWAVFQPKATLTTNEYTPLEQQGRDLYVSNGCLYCHSQFQRPLDVAPGQPSESGAYVYDRPHQLGTLRTGPNLSQIGRKRGDAWERDHLKFPRRFTPDSIMPSFEFLSDKQLEALVAYLNTLGNKELASTDLMIPNEYLHKTNPISVTATSFAMGRNIYQEKCLTCHGCSGKGDGPYAMIQNARPADLRQQRYYQQPDGFFLWRLSNGVPGTQMPKWELSLTEGQMWYAILFVRTAYMDMAPHLIDEGDLPKEYAAMKDPLGSTPATDSLMAGKRLYIANCSYCHGYSGAGDGPGAVATPLYPGLLPAPPNFMETSTYKDWTDGDWFWRISESLPMRAMPAWKLTLSEEQRWLLADYVRYMLVFPNKDNEPADADTPKKYDALKQPVTTSIMNGRNVYFRRCWLCHGDAGQGEGPKGTNLAPPPANFTDPDVKKMTDGRWFWRLTDGVDNSAMPTWGLLLSQQDRWDAIDYVKKTFVFPSEPADVSDELPIQYQALEAPWPDTPEARADGAALYKELCNECHGPKGKGDGPSGTKIKPTPANLTEDPALTAGPSWWYWRLSEGVVGPNKDGTPHPTAMPNWKMPLTMQQRWNLVYYTRSLVGATKGD